MFPCPFTARMASGACSNSSWSIVSRSRNSLLACERAAVRPCTRRSNSSRAPRNASSPRVRSVATAARVRAISALIVMNTCSNSSDSFCTSRTNGPKPRSVPKIAITDNKNVAVAVSREPKRNATQMRIGTQMYGSRYRRTSMDNSDPKTACPIRMRIAAIKTASAPRRFCHRPRGCGGLPFSRARSRVCHPQQEQRGHEEIPGRVPQPPRQPNRFIFVPAGIAAQAEGGHAAGRAHHRAEHCGQCRELEYILRPLKCVPAIGESVDQKCPEQSFQGVARGDTEACGDRPCRGDIDKKCTEEDGRPDAITEHEQRCQRNPGGRPDR